MAQINGKLPKDLINVRDLMNMFGVSLQTTHRWRNGRGLPFHKLSVPGLDQKNKTSVPVRFSIKEVTEWAKENKVPILKRPRINSKTGKVTFKLSLRSDFINAQ